MGAWGAGNFENDDALDWAATLEDANDLSSIEQALQAIAGNDDYLEAPDCSVALAAAEVVAALRNPASSHDEFPDQCLAFLERCSGLLTDELRHLATQAVQKIVASSELQELWSESDESDHWLTTQTRLLQSLS